VDNSGPWQDYEETESGPWTDYAHLPKPPYQNNPVKANPADTGNTYTTALGQQWTMPAGLSHVLEGAGKLYTDIGLGAKQTWAQMMGNDPNTVTDPVTGQTSAEKRTRDKPLQATTGAKVGELAGALPLAFVPGANSYGGAAALGGALGATQPTVGDESRLLNTGIGGAAGVAGKWGGDKVGHWLTQRAAQPFMGWNQQTANRAFADAVGSTAPKLDQPAIAETAQRLGGIFTQARNPAVQVPIPGATSQVLSDAESGLSASSREAFWRDPQVNELMGHLQAGTANAKELGTISSKLGNTAAGEMSSKGGDRELGKALFALREHADDLVGQSITDPALSAAYDAARPQYRTFLMARRPTILNSTTGDVNMRNLGNYLQKADFAGFAKGGNTSDLYNAARFGQATGLGSRPPPPILQPIKWAGYHAVNNPLIGALGGTVSRLGAPLAPGLKAPARGLLLEAPKVGSSYFDQ
jgi:hypothetical protein